MSHDYECFDLEKVGDVAIARLKGGGLDDAWTTQLGDELLTLIYSDNVRKLILSFNNIDCLFSTLLGKLVRLKRAMESTGGRLKLIDVNPLAREVFSVCKLDTQFEFAPDSQTALKDW
jgi:anti-anti-sigma factor